MKSFTIALDVDDVLFPCIEPACQAVGIDPAKIVDWDLGKCEGLTDAERSALLYTMSRDDFLSAQKPYKGAVEMIDKLVKAGHNVLIASAVEPGGMTRRGMMLIQMFPMLEPKNIMLGGRKELLNVDIMLDDSPYNLGNVRYPVLFDRTHNANESGYLRVKGYDEFISLVESLAKMPDIFAHVTGVGNPGIVCLVGPSGSGKSFLCDELEKNPIFKKVRALTDRAPRAGEKNGKEYFFVNKEKFQEAVSEGKLVENTSYCGNNYGISFKELEGIWKDGRIGVKPVDIEGARAIKQAYPDKALILFIRRGKDELVKAIIERDCPTEDKVARIMSIDSEYANEQLCDFTVYNNGSLDHAIGQILRMIG